VTVFLLAGKHDVELLDTPAEILIGGGDAHGSAHHRGLSFEPLETGCQCGGRHKEALGFQPRRRMGSRSRKITAKRLGHRPGIENIGVPGKHGSTHHRGLSLEPPDAGHQCGDRHKEAFGLQAAVKDRVTVTKKGRLR
jgi:hypothetical protein